MQLDPVYYWKVCSVKSRTII